MNLWIGTSGYYYRDWVGPFYPPGTRSDQMLTQYTRHFPIVELNFTFYRPPTPSMLAKLAEQAPAGFQFLVKLPRTLSHEEKTDDLASFRLAVEEMRRRNCLFGLLCQLPQASHLDQRHQEWLQILGEELGDCRLAIEFRHRSWIGPDIIDWLKERRLDLVSVDAPALPSLYPSGLVQSSQRVYVRFHSRKSENWYQSDKQRYDYDYTDEELTDWINALTRSTAPTQDALLLFNNCHRAQAAANAMRMRELVLRLSPNLNVVPPFAVHEPGTQQRSLF